MSRHLVAFTLIALLAGCASYATPGPAADLRAVGVSEEIRFNQTDLSVIQALQKVPLAQLPTGIAVARIQGTGYRSRTMTASYGDPRGAFSVVTVRDVEKPEQIARLAQLPNVRGIAPIGRMLLPASLTSDADLRAAAAKLRADMLLIYTFDTQFRVNDKARPLSVVTLGLSPNKRITVNSTVSAVLLDTRNGYVYGLAEATAARRALTNAWQSDVAADAERLKTEAEAFEKLIGELETMWSGVNAELSARPAPAPTKSPAANANG